jgi:hypothetical protein
MRILLIPSVIIAVVVAALLLASPPRSTIAPQSGSSIALPVG